MAAALSASIHALVPSENWDDDFEFHSQGMNKHNDKRPNDRQHAFRPQTPPTTSRMSTVSSQYTQEDWDADSRQASPQPSAKMISNRNIPSGSPSRRSHETENWDDEFDASPAAIRLGVGSRVSPTLTTPSGKQRQHSPPPPTVLGVLTDKKNLKTPPPLETWAEPGPSTPSSKRASVNSNPSVSIKETENWDDDFDLDKADSPARRSVKKGVKPRATKKAQLVESWDDEFALAPLRGSPFKGPSTRTHLSSSSPSRSRVNATGRAALLEYSSSSDSEDELPRQLHYPAPQHNLYGEEEQEEEDAGEFGHIPKRRDSDEEEDRTVTARTRHRLARLSTPLANSSPPPPMPSLPFFPRPFPRSPTSSVFSVPATTHTHSSYNSTTHLRPSISRSSSGAGGLSGLPPSPPIHKERERRRLRKKSRPHNLPNAQTYELTAVRSRHYTMPKSFSDGELEITEREEDLPRPRTPSPPPPISIPSTPIGTGNGPAVGATPQSQAKGAALLSRIGSVKKRWSVGGRKRGGSVTPAEVSQDSSQPSQESRGQGDHTPRPQSSRSSLHRHTPLPPPSNSWFFRGHGVSGREEVAHSQQAVGGSRSGSMTDLSLRESDVAYTPSGAKSTGKERETAKLVKRKSLGFVHLRRGHVPPSSSYSNEPAASGRKELGKRPISMQPSSPSPASHQHQLGQRHVSYAHAKGVRDRESEVEDREREAEKQKGEQEKDEGSRSFMGSVRRISLVGARRHQRTKSGVSLSGVVATIGAMSSTGSRRSLDGGKALDGQVVDEKDKKQGSSIPSSDPKLNVNSSTNSTSTSHWNTNANTTPTTPKNKAKVPSYPPIELLPSIELQPLAPPKVNLPQTRTPEQPLHSFTLAEPILTVAAKSPSTPDCKKPPSTQSHVTDFPSVKSPLTPSSNVLNAPTTPGRRPSPSSPTKSPSSPQSASLGRAAVVPSGSEPSKSGNAIGGGAGGGGVPRRNSLGDLKIPARISQAQVGLRRDLGMVREFAANVEQLKELQQTYHSLVIEVQSILDMQAHLHVTSSTAPPPQKAMSPAFFSSKKKTRPRSNTNPTPTLPSSQSQLAYKELASAFYTINSKYRISWECAELLIELGSGSATNTGPPTSVSVPVMHGGSEKNAGGKGRERAITLAGDESKPPTPIPGAQPSSGDLSRPGHGPPLASPPSLAWRASTGRHDLNQRQLILLREMLNNADASLISEASPHSPIPEEPPSTVLPNDTLQVNREWRWGGDAMSSTITLPSEESSQPYRTAGVDAKKKRRSSRLGMSGIRDMLRALKRNNTASTLAAAPPLPPPPMPASSTSLSTDSSFDGHSQHQYVHPRLPTQGFRGRPKGSIGPDSVRSTRDVGTTSPYTSSLSVKPSPRRPSLASIFRLGGTKNRLPTPPDATTTMDRGESNHMTSSTSTGEEDWDRMDSASDLDAAAKALGIPVDGAATLRGRKNKLRSKGRSPYLQHDPSVTESFLAQLTPKRSASASQSSIWGGGGGDSPSNSNQNVAHSRSTRLSNVEEHGDDHRLAHVPPLPLLRSSSKGRDSSPSGSRRMTQTGLPASGSVRSMPPQPVGQLSDPKLAMTPENIKPLLENAKEVHSRLNECIAEIRGLVQGRA